MTKKKTKVGQGSSEVRLYRYYSEWWCHTTMRNTYSKFKQWCFDSSKLISSVIFKRNTLAIKINICLSFKARKALSKL